MAKKKSSSLKAMTTDTSGPSPMPVNVVKPSKEDVERQRKYRAEDALRDLERAAEHRKNKELMKDVKTLAREKVACLKTIK